MAERVALRIKNVAKAVLVSGQAYQDPKDALNEFVSNAADEYIEAGLRGEQIRVVLRRRGQRSFIAIGTIWVALDLAAMGALWTLSHRAYSPAIELIAVVWEAFLAKVDESLPRQHILIFQR